MITDGAWGSQFLELGLAAGELGDAWNLTHPDRVEAIPRAYAAAGSQVVLTNTFSANRISLTGHGLEGRIQEINEAGVAISRRAAGGQARVFGSIGPTGKLLVTGDVTPEQLTAGLPGTGGLSGGRRRGGHRDRDHGGPDRDQSGDSGRAERPGCPWWPAWRTHPGRTGTAP